MAMNRLCISTEPALLDVELPSTMVESPSVSTFLPEEEVSICPLLSTTNGTASPLTHSHPLTPSTDNDNDHDNAADNLCNEDKAETSSSTGSSSGLGMDAPESATTALFNKHTYQHFQINNTMMVQDGNGHMGSNITLSKDTPTFVSWNWPLIRKCTFFIFMSSLFAMCAVVIAMIVMLPKTCNPKTVWYRGGVFYEIFPASFQDSNDDGVGDIRGIGNRVDYLVSLGIAAVRLNSIYPSPHYPDDYENITSLTEIASVLGNTKDMLDLTKSLHFRNISLILDLPIIPFVEVSDKANTSIAGNNAVIPNEMEVEIKDTVMSAMHMWIKLGVDGFFIKGLEHYLGNIDFVRNVKQWKSEIGPNRVLIVSESYVSKLDVEKRLQLLPYVDLIDVYLNVFDGTKYMESQIRQILKSDFAPTEEGAWIQWSIGGVERERITRHRDDYNRTLAATILQLMLPGTPSIFYGDEIALKGDSSLYNQHNEHNETKHLQHFTIMQWSNNTLQFTSRETIPWLLQTPTHRFDHFDIISKMIALRNRSPSIYKNSICKMDAILPNTQIRRSHDDILLVERMYPRRNSFVSISNFGNNLVSMDMTSMYYSGLEMLKKINGPKIYFRNFEIGPLETIVVKLDK